MAVAAVLLGFLRDVKPGDVEEVVLGEHSDGPSIGFCCGHVVLAAVVAGWAAPSDNGATVVITEYYNPYNDKKVVNNFFDRSCSLIHEIGDIITTAINDQLRTRAQAHGFTSVDFKAPFDGHGAGSGDPYVFGSDCETVGALTAVDFDLGWPPVNTETSKQEIQKRFDPHPNTAGTLAQANAILEVLQ